MALSETALIAQRDSLNTLLASVLTSPKPTYTVEGRSFQWTQYLAELRAQIDTVNHLIDISQPVELHTEGY